MRSACGEARAPYIAARIRVLLGRAFLGLGDRDGADLERGAARKVFEVLGAAPDLAALESPRRPCGIEGATTDLSKRELEVLRPLSKGKTNKAIATRALRERTHRPSSREQHLHEDRCHQPRRCDVVRLRERPLSRGGWVGFPTAEAPKWAVLRKSGRAPRRRFVSMKRGGSPLSEPMRTDQWSILPPWRPGTRSPPVTTPTSRPAKSSWRRETLKRAGLEAGHPFPRRRCRHGGPEPSRRAARRHRGRNDRSPK